MCLQYYIIFSLILKIKVLGKLRVGTGSFILRQKCRKNHYLHKVKKIKFFIRYHGRKLKNNLTFAFYVVGTCFLKYCLSQAQKLLKQKLVSFRIDG